MVPVLLIISVRSAQIEDMISASVAGTRPPVVFLSLLFANWSSLFRTIRSRCLIMPLMFGWVAVRAHYEKNHTHWVQHHPYLLSPCLQQMELDQRGKSQTLDWTSLPQWCQADYQTQSLQVVHLVHCFGHCSWRNFANLKYIGLENTTGCSWRVQSDSD